MKKKCQKCGYIRIHGIKSNGVCQSQCKECQKKYSRRHYRLNKKRYINLNLKRRRNFKLQIVEYLRTHPCIDCGESDPVVLDFDHVRGKKKENVSILINSGSRQMALLEIAKCEVRCANCHRRKTFGNLNKFSGLSSKRTRHESSKLAIPV